MYSESVQKCRYIRLDTVQIKSPPGWFGALPIFNGNDILFHSFRLWKCVYVQRAPLTHTCISFKTNIHLEILFLAIAFAIAIHENSLSLAMVSDVETVGAKFENI